MDMKTATYVGSHNQEGINLICAKLKNEGIRISKVILQCSAFYNEDIARLKRVARAFE